MDKIEAGHCSANDSRNIEDSGLRDLYMNMLMDKSDFGVLKCKIDSVLSIQFCNTYFYKMTGYSETEFLKEFHGSFMEAVCNMDRLDFKQKLRKAQKNDTDISVEIRLKRRDGQLFWVSFCGVLGTDQEGMAYIACMVKDIQYTREIEGQLRLQSVRYHVLKKITNEPVFEYDDLSDTMVISDNRDNTESRIIHNYRREIRSSGYIHPDDVEQYCREFDASLNQDKLSIHEFRTNLFSAEYIWYRAVYTNIMDEESGMVKLIGKMENIHADKMKQQDLMVKSMYDPMTKLLNRATVKHMIEEKIRTCSREQHALLIVDIDNFKMVNDNLGHLFGDTVLINFAEELQKIYSDDEIVGRIGGDEFMVFIPNATRELIEEKAQKTCQIFQHVYSGNLNDINVSTSVGISLYPQDGDHYKALFQCSDQALYVCKQQGKNQYNYYKGEAPKTMESSELELMEHYRMENVREDRNNQETREMIEFAFHILTETKDVISGIGLVLESLCKRMELQAGMLFEELDISGGVKLTYCWKENQGMLQNDGEVRLDFKEWNRLVEQLKQKSQFQTKDMSEFEQVSGVFNYLGQMAAKSVLCDGIYDGEDINGALLLVDSKQGREFNSDDRNMVRVILKIIGSYLMQVRGTQRINHKIDRLTNYDVVTGRYRIEKFKAELRRILDEEKKEYDGFIYAILYMDICNFKNINDIYGYSLGDQVLYELSEIIRKRDNYIIGCRDFADNMISVLKFDSRENCVDQLLHIEEEFNRSQKRFLRHTTNLTTGIYFINNCSLNISQMIDNANLARKYIKEQPNCRYGVFDENLEQHFIQNQQIESSMEEALRHGEFKVFLQPKYDLATGRIVAAEALTRWQKPDQHFMVPDEFIPVFEKNGFITQVDFYVLEVVCKMLKERILEHQPYVSVSINQSRYLLHDEHYVDKIKHMIDQYDIPSRILEFELTESLFFEDSKAMIEIMHRLKQLGVSVSIDDFGSGYSSLNVLKDVPADIIKIDKEFLNASGDPKESEIIIRKTIEMAKELHKKVVCEGVETKQQADFLKEVECDLVQGYLYAKPMPMEEFFDLLEQEQQKE